MSDPIQHNFTRRDLRSLNCVLPGVSVEYDVQFGDFRNPTAIHLSIKFNRELHHHEISIR